MYDFPPNHYQPFFTGTKWSLFGWHSLVMIVGLGFMAYLIRKKRQPHFYDSMLVFAAATIMTAIFLSGDRTVSPLPEYIGLFVFAVWILTIGTIVRVLYRLEEQGDSEGAVLSVIAMVVSGGLLVAMLLPPIEQPRGPRRRTQCKNNLKQIGLALHNFHDTNSHFPVASSGEPPHSWRIDLLPYIDHLPMHKEYNFDHRWNERENNTIAKTKMKIFKCPKDRYEPGPDEYPTTAYVAVTGTNTIWPKDEGVQVRQITDGTSNTIMVVEACGQRIPWAEPRDISLDKTPTGVNLPGSKLNHSDGIVSSYHLFGANILMGDGSVRFLGEETDPQVLRSLITRNGGEEVSDF